MLFLWLAAIRASVFGLSSDLATRCAAVGRLYLIRWLGLPPRRA